MNIYGNFREFPRKMVHCLGWYYNDTCPNKWGRKLFGVVFFQYYGRTIFQMFGHATCCFGDFFLVAMMHYGKLT